MLAVRLAVRWGLFPSWERSILASDFPGRQLGGLAESRRHPEERRGAATGAPTGTEGL